MNFLKYLVALALAAGLAACGGGGDEATTTPQQAAVALQAAAKAQAAPRMDALTSDQAAEALFTFAEQALPQLFPGPKTTITYAPFKVRYYPETGLYLGVVTQSGTAYTLDGVYVLGGIFGNDTPYYAGQVSSYVDTSGGSTGGNMTLDITVTVMGVTQSYTFYSVPAPNTQETFCSDLSSDATFTSLTQIPGYTGSLTINSCSFSGNTGNITATLNVTSPYTLTVPFAVTYTFR